MEMKVLNRETGEMETPILRSPGNYNADLVSREAATICPEDTLTQQNTLDECDINKIVERFRPTGMLPQVQAPPMYGDFSDITSFQEAHDRVNDARKAFMTLPARIRAEFSNDPAEYVDAFDQAVENNDWETLQRMGLISQAELAQRRSTQGEPPVPPDPPKSPEGSKTDSN